MPIIDGKLVPLLLWRMTEDFQDFDWGCELQAPFELPKFIDALLPEAAQKGMSVVLQFCLYHTEKLYPPEAEKPAEEPQGGVE